MGPDKNGALAPPSLSLWNYAAGAGTARAHSRSNIEVERCNPGSPLRTLTGSQSSES